MHRLEIECQIVSREQQNISGILLEAALYRLDAEEPSGAIMVKETTVGTLSNDHWVSVDTSAKVNFKEAWYGGLLEVLNWSRWGFTLNELWDCTNPISKNFSLVST